jgi:hypothetical protein
MATTVDIVTATGDSVSYVPLQALVSREIGEDEARAETEGIFTVEASRARFMAIETGISDDKNIEITGSIPAGSQVVTGPFKILRDLEDSTKVKVLTKKEE